jgi:hypothetical protein
MHWSVLATIAAGLVLATTGCGGVGSTHPQPDVGTDVPIYPDGAIETARTDGGGFATATPITIGATYTNGTLADPINSRDYYKFTGTAGQAIVVATKAKINSPSNPFDATYLDLVVTIYDSSQTTIALQDDPWPRISNDPHLFTVLPTAGDYYVTIEDCNSAFIVGCASAGTITHKDYSIAIFNVESLGPQVPVVEGATDQDGTTANAIPIVFNASSSLDAGTGGTTCVDDVIAGGFQTGTDLDVYSFTIPTNYAGEPLYRATAAFYLQIPGVAHGDGSTANMKVWIADAANPTTHLAEIDQSNFGYGASNNCPAELNVPVTPGSQYFLYVQNGQGAAGARDFYFIVRSDDLVRADGIYLGPKETADATNGDISTPEVLTPQTKTTGVWYGVAGEIGGAGTDVDYYSVAVPTTVAGVNVLCEAQRLGSGLRGFKYTLMQPDGTTLTHGSASETPTTDLSLTGITIPTGISTLILKVEAASQDPNVSGTYYRCQVQLHS